MHRAFRLSAILLAYILFAAPLAAQEATLSIAITNQGKPMPKAWFGVYHPGQRNSYVKYAHSGRTLKVPPGSYDIGIHFQQDTVEISKWLEKQDLSGERVEGFELGTPLTEVCYRITNGTHDPGNKVWWGVYRNKEENYLRYTRSGQCLLVTSGAYTIGLHYEDDALKETRWLENETFEGERVDRTFDFGVPIAEVKFTVTNSGANAGRKAWWGLYEPGKHASYLRYKWSGESMTFKAGTYDIGIEYADGALKKKIWLENEKFEGAVDRTVEMNAATARAKVSVTNGGNNVGRKAWWGIYKPGQRGHYLAYKYSGEPLTIDSGTYDIGVFFEDGAAREERWLENQVLDAEYEKSVELGTPLAEVKILVTNNGIDVKRKAWWGLYEPGERNHYLAYRYAGDTMTIQEGGYDLGVHFEDGAVKITRWIPDFEAKGTIEKTIELSAGIATLAVRVQRKGAHLEKAWCGAYKTRKNASYDAYAYSEKPMRVLTGTYDIGCFSSEKGGHVENWLEKQEIKTDTHLEIEMEEAPASLIVKHAEKSGAPGSPASLASGNDSNLSIIFDASGSMAAKVEEQKNRIDVAKEVLGEVVDSLPKNVRVELQVYGTAPKAKADCRDTKTLYPLAPADPKMLKDAISTLKPGGYTPIAYSLERAAAALPKGANNSLILITDGIESCNGDPCAVAARLSREGFVARSFVVGFGLYLDKGRFLSCIGRYYPATGRQALKDALAEVVSAALKPVTGRVSVFQPGDRKEALAQGGLNEELKIPSGTYDVVIRIGDAEQVIPNAKIAGKTELTAP